MKPAFVKTALTLVDQNFQELVKVFATLNALVLAKDTSATLVAGDNSITPTVVNPRGRVITFQSAAAALFDKGLIGDKWIINASAPCSIRLAFF